IILSTGSSGAFNTIFIKKIAYKIHKKNQKSFYQETKSHAKLNPQGCGFVFFKSLPQKQTRPQKTKSVLYNKKTTHHKI
ncbi:hypothetical protein, partial [Enterobacter intestinihominis]